MSVKFCFTKPDGVQEDLAIVEEKLSEFCGEPVNKEALPLVNNISDIGCNILERTSKTNEVTVDLIGKYMIHLMKDNLPMYNKICLHKNGKFIASFPKFLCQDYTFKAWR